MRRAIHNVFGLVLLGIALVPGPVLGQNDAEDFGAFWFNKERAQAASAAQIVGMGDDPIAALALRAAGLHWIVWDEVGFAEQFAPELRPSLLQNIQDGRWLPNMVAKPKDEIQVPDMAFYKAYSDALVNAYWTPPEAFKKSAAENRTVTYAHLMSTPNRYRGKVIPIQRGRLVMLRKEEPTILAKNEGVKSVYVGWVFGETKHANPFCIQFPILPKGLEPAEKMDKTIAFDGYFLATFKYEGARKDDRPRILTTPLLVGPTVVVENEAAPVEANEIPMAILVLGIAVGFLLFLSVVFFLMYFLLQRGDRQILSTLDEIKQKHTPNQFKDEGDLGTATNPAPAHLIGNGQPPARLPEARPIDPERN